MALRMLVMMMVIMVLLMMTVMMVSSYCDICATFADELIPSLWLKLNIFQTDRSRNTRSTLENHNERMREARMCDETHEEQSAVVNC